MGPQQLLVSAHKLGRNELVAAALEPIHDGADEAALNGVRLEHDECALCVLRVLELCL